MRKINQPILRIIISIYAILHSLFILYTCLFGVFVEGIQRSLHLLFLLPLGFLLFPANRNSPKDQPSLIDYILCGLAFLVCLYFFVNNQRFINRWMFVDPLSLLDEIMGVIAVIIVIEATRRIVTPVMAALAVIAISYLLFGHHIPGILSHAPFSFSKIIEINYMGSDLESIFGLLVGISATYVSLFVLFGSFIAATPIGKYFNEFSAAITGKSIGGPAKVAVLSSGLFGMISGIGASNVYTTGTFTIPMMKKIGFKPEFAGAVEAAASTGGEYMPPVMGAAAFLMAEFTGIPYMKIALGASISAVLYFFSLFVFIDYVSKKNNNRLRNVEEEVKDWKYILSGSYLFLPLLALLVMLSLKYTPLLAGFSAIVVTILVMFSEFINGNINLKNVFKNIFYALEDGAKNTILIAVAIACSGIIIGAITHTALGLVFLSTVMTFAKGNLFISLFIVMVTCLILGMGLPTSAAYIMVATLAVPALLNLNVNILAAHLFCFYFAIISAVTPPVAISAYCAAGLAGADPVKTGIEAFKIASVAFVVPYAFVYNNALITQGSLWEIIYSTLFALIGLKIFVKGMVGYFGNKFEIINNPVSLKLKFFSLLLRVGIILLGITILFIPYILF